MERKAPPTYFQARMLAESLREEIFKLYPWDGFTMEWDNSTDEWIAVCIIQANGFKRLLYDWGLKSLPTTPDRIKNIRIRAEVRRVARSIK